MNHVNFLFRLTEAEVTAALEEIKSLDWASLPTRRRSSKVFDTSQTLHLRIHDTSKYVPLPNKTFVENCGEIIECIPTVDAPKYSKILALAELVSERLKATELGRLMVVNLLPNGRVPLHIDPGPYFEHYTRVHVVLETNPGVVFLGPRGSEPMHMARLGVYSLVNTDYHGVENNSEVNRIHLIYDLKCSVEVGP